MKVTTKNPVALAKRVFWLAYQASGGPSGMGIFQARNNATEEDVWDNVCTAGDYPHGQNVPGFIEPKRPYADYVFGRMMKVGLTLTEDSVEIQDRLATHDYQSWARKYPYFSDLLIAAVDSLK